MVRQPRDIQMAYRQQTLDIDSVRESIYVMFPIKVNPEAPIQTSAANETSWIDNLGEKYGMQFSDLATITGESKHLSYESLIDENGDWLDKCSWAFPTERFWGAWRKAKNALKATGYETIKLGDIWLVYVWR